MLAFALIFWYCCDDWIASKLPADYAWVGEVPIPAFIIAFIVAWVISPKIVIQKS